MIIYIWHHYEQVSYQPSLETLQGQSVGREKRRDESFQVRVEEPLGTDSHRTISKNSSGCRLLIGHKKCFVSLCPIGKHISRVLFVCSYDGYCLDHSLSCSCTKEMPQSGNFQFQIKSPSDFKILSARKTKDAFPKIEASSYNRYSCLHWPCLA